MKQTKEKPFKIAFVKDLEAQYLREEITYSRMVELLNEKALEWHLNKINMKVTQTAGWIDIQQEKPTANGLYHVFGGSTNIHTQFSFHYDVEADFWHDGDLENLTDSKVLYWLKIITPYADPIRLFQQVTR